MNTQQKISDMELWLVIGALFTVDVVQILLDFFLVGLGANRVIDIGVAMSFGFYLIIRGQADQKALMALVVTFLGEEIPVVDVLPFWCLDGWYFRKRYKEKEAMARAQAETEAQATANQNQMRAVKKEFAQKSGDVRMYMENK